MGLEHARWTSVKLHSDISDGSSSHQDNATHVKLVQVCIDSLKWRFSDRQQDATKSIDDADYLGTEVGNKGRGVELHSLPVRFVDNVTAL